MNDPNSSAWLEIIAEVAHELKTPMTSAAGFIDLVMNCGDPLSARQERFATMALGALGQMEMLVLQLLDMARVMDDRAVETRPCDLPFVIDHAISRITDLAERQQVTIHAELDADIGSIESDERILEQVLVNLLSNAVKYNRPGGDVWVRAQGMAESVEVSVRDNGRGISQEALPHVFDRFYREKRDRRIEGTGLGLAIVKSLIEKQGGHIRVESAPEQGASFTFILPRVQRLSEGRAVIYEALAPLIERADSRDDSREDSSETLDSVDDRLQEPHEFPRDESDLAEQQ